MGKGERIRAKRAARERGADDKARVTLRYGVQQFELTPAQEVMYNAACRANGGHGVYELEELGDLLGVPKP